MTKALGKDINEFYNNHFPEGHYIDDFTEDYGDFLEKYLDDQGNLCLPLTEKFELNAFGIIIPEGSNSDNGTSFSSCFKRWLKQQKTATILVEVAVGDKEWAVERLKTLGWRVIG